MLFAIQGLFSDVFRFKLLSAITSIFCFAFSHSLWGQVITYNSDVDTSIFKSIKPAYELWDEFINSGSDSAGALFWDEEEVLRLGIKDYFLIKNRMNFGVSDLLQLWKNYGHVHTFSITREQDLYKIKAGFAFKNKTPQDTSQEQYNYMYLFHVYAREIDGVLRLCNAVEINRKLYCKEETVGYIKYIFPKHVSFDKHEAIRQNNFLLELSSRFKVQLDTVEYFYAPVREELNRLIGFDFILGSSGSEIPSGYADPENKRVYVNGTGFYYPHELVHIFLNPIYPKSHLWFNEGLATYYGGSRGKSLDWHLKEAYIFLKDKDSIDLSNMTAYQNMTEYTGYRYVLGGLLMKLAVEKEGVPMVKKLMKAGKSDSAFYAAIEQHLEIKREDLNEFLRAMLKTAYHNVSEPLHVHGNDTFYSVTEYIDAVLGINDSFFREPSFDPPITSMERGEIFSCRYTELADQLLSFNIPNFLFNPGLDYTTEGLIYGTVHTEKTISLRYDLINALSQQQLEHLIITIKKYDYKKVLNQRFKGPYNVDMVPYSEYSTWQLIKAVYKGKKLRTKYSGMYMR